MLARRLAWLLVPALAGCGGSPFGDAGPDIDEFTYERSLSTGPSELYVFVVDDTSTGSTLRTAVTDAVASYDARLAAAGCDSPFDPADFHPVRRDAWVVHPSKTGDERISGYPAEPALHWQTTQRSDDDAALWASAVNDSIGESATSKAAFRPLESLSDTAALLDQRRPAQTDAEQALLDALDPAAEGLFVLAAASEDASPDAPESYAAPLGTNLYLDPPIVPAATPSAERDCGALGGDASPRFQAWLGAAHVDYASLWPCDNPLILEPLRGSCTWRCLSRPIAVNADGSADCVVMTRIPVDDQCPAEFGWLDPLDAHGVRTPRVVHDELGDYRSCEVHQLDGAALTSCRTSLDCEDCEPGFCVTEVPDLLPSERCLPGQSFPPFRFVAGAGEARNAGATIMCHVAQP